MNRKIVQHGESTLTISLPFRWTKKYNLKKGDDILLEPVGKNLLIKVDNEPKKTSKILKYKKGEVFFGRTLLNLYKEGYDEIIIEFQETVPLSRIIDQNTELLGFEIVEHLGNKCIIRNIANIVKEEFDTILKRLFIITLSLARETYNIIKSGRETDMKLQLGVEKEVNKLVNYLQRVLNKGDIDSIPKITYLYVLTERLEMIGDVLGEICMTIQKKKVLLSKKDLAYFELVVNYFNDVYMQYYSGNKTVSELKKQRVTLYEKFYFIKPINQENYIIMSLLKELLDLIHHIEVSLE